MSTEIKPAFIPVPGGPKSDPTLRRTFILYYRYGAQKPSDKVFEHVGTLRDAITRGKQHCETMDFRFIAVRPFIVDLDDQERQRTESNTEDY